MASERTREPVAGRKLADLRHLVHRIGHRAGPGIFDLHITKLRIDLQNVAAHLRLEPARRRGARRDASAPQQPVVRHDAIIIAGAARIGDRAGIAHRLEQLFAERRRHRHIGQDRQHGRGDLLIDRADPGATGEHHMARAHQALQRLHALAHAAGSIPIACVF